MIIMLPRKHSKSNYLLESFKGLNGIKKCEVCYDKGTITDEFESIECDCQKLKP